MFNMFESLADRLSILNHNVRELLVKLYTWNTTEADKVLITLRTEDVPYVEDFIIPSRKAMINSVSTSMIRPTTNIALFEDNKYVINSDSPAITYLSVDSYSNKEIVFYPTSTNSIYTVLLDIAKIESSICTKIVIKDSYGLILAVIYPSSIYNKVKVVVQSVETSIGNNRYELLDLVHF